VGGTCRGRGNEGDEGEGIWLMDFIYEKEQWNFLQLLEVELEGGWGGEMVGHPNQHTM
jgi:hypothetical protein